MSLRQKMMIAITLLVIIPVTAMGVLTYLLFSDKMATSSEQMTLNVLEETDSRLGDMLAEVTRTTDTLLTDPLVQRHLKLHESPGAASLSGWAEPDDLFEDKMNNLLAMNPQIGVFYLYNRSKAVYVSESASPPSLTSLEEQQWYQTAAAGNGKPVWLNPEELRLAPPFRPFLVQVRLIPDFTDLTKLGLLVVTLKPNQMEAVLDDASRRLGGQVMLVQEQRVLLFGASRGEELEAARGCTHPDHKQGTYSRAGTGRGLSVFCIPSTLEGWHLASVAPVKGLAEDSMQIRGLIVLLLVLTLFSTLVFDFFYTRRLTQTIAAVVRAMKLAERGRFRQIAVHHPSHRDESHLLITGFNRMSQQTEELIRRVEDEQKRLRRAEMQALMAQINPHFIYNSLESINSLAVLEGNTAISRMAISLGRLLRITISESSQLVSIGTEIEHVKHYLRIQSYRYGDKLGYSLELPPQLAHYTCMKLIFQPLVENALYHGIEPLRRKGFISIRVFEMDEADLCLEVADTGQGFSNERLAQLAEHADRVRQIKHGEASSGVGLMNVHERIRLHYGSRYGLMICSEVYKKTTIRIRIPKQ